MQRKIKLLAIAVVAAIGAVIYMAPVSGQKGLAPDGDAALIYGIKIPAGYRDWRMISVATLANP